MLRRNEWVFHHFHAAELRHRVARVSVLAQHLIPELIVDFRLVFAYNQPSNA
ncbi:MAG: hypothetical protein WA175_10650 [Candidatus Acidiferrales bacterium]